MGVLNMRERKMYNETLSITDRNNGCGGRLVYGFDSGGARAAEGFCSREVDRKAADGARSEDGGRGASGDAGAVTGQARTNRAA